MSIGCIIQVFTNSQSSGNDRLVLLCIADEADDEGRNAFPSIRRLAGKANCHTDTVIECIKRLEARGELEVIRPEKQGRGRYNKYKVLLRNIGIPDVSDRGSVTGSVEGLVRTQPRQSDDQSAPKGPSIRALSDRYGSYPQGSFQPERCDCGDCDAGWIENEDGIVTKCPNAA
jgi:hypothetical protein